MLRGTQTEGTPFHMFKNKGHKTKMIKGRKGGFYIMEENKLEDLKVYEGLAEELGVDLEEDVDLEGSEDDEEQEEYTGLEEDFEVGDEDEDFDVEDEYDEDDEDAEPSLTATSVHEATELSIKNDGAEVELLINPSVNRGNNDDSGEGLNVSLQVNSKIYIRSSKVKIDDIAFSSFKKVSRKDTITGLTGVIGEWGVVTPIHIMELRDEAYMILDGARRLFGAVRNNITEVPAQIWRFEDKTEGKKKANLISLMLNRSQGFRASEMWEQMQILETVNNATPGLIEFLLQMQSGQSMKLKDVMLADDDYFEIREALILGEIDIETAYKKLCAERKKENQLEKEDAIVIAGGASEDGDTIDDEQRLSTDAVKDLLEISDQVDIEDETLDSLNKSSEAKQGDYVQDPKAREPLDPKLRNAVLTRDEFTCQCCGEGGQAYLAVLTAHHIIEVVQGGPDTEENLITLCVKCHILLHSYSWGKITVDLNTLDEDEKNKFKKIFKLGNVIIEADKKLGRTHKGVNPSVKHPFPGAGLKDNKLAYNNKQSAETSDENTPEVTESEKGE